MLNEETEKFVAGAFPRFGENKKREIARLLYELRKKGEKWRDILPLKEQNYSRIKKILLKARYPLSYGKYPLDRFYLPKLEINGKLRFRKEKEIFSPAEIYADDFSLKSGIPEKAALKYPRAKIVRLSKPKEEIREMAKKPLTYSERKKRLFFLKENHDFQKKCPCTREAVGCGYRIFNTGFGCPMDCVYCYLQEYQNFPGIIIHTNLENFAEKSLSRPRLPGRKTRIGSGEFTDSLVFDDITGFSLRIMEQFSERVDLLFEFKTKTANIGNLLSVKPAPNAVAAWSLNPPGTIGENEFFSATLDERIAAAKACSEKGYKIAFHFDPIIKSANWKREYEETAEKVFSAVHPEKVSWISMGTLRFNRNMKRIIENRFPENRILDEEMIIGFDGKLRYPDFIRVEIYSAMLRALSRCGISMDKVYLCMESPEVWKRSGLSPSFRW